MLFIALFFFPCKGKKNLGKRKAFGFFFYLKKIEKREKDTLFFTWERGRRASLASRAFFILFFPLFLTLNYFYFIYLDITFEWWVSSISGTPKRLRNFSFINDYSYFTTNDSLWPAQDVFTIPQYCPNAVTVKNCSIEQIFFS